ncbi:hypothetical protein ALC57_13221 [Trachymyrmex cornetzi]|uniref:Uncharacterized protein n=1 Tax=Trachymyrmex cornetzi TaxID=471704 RepID=A0A151IZP1_9HYME|nr:hypothetical protein ALC57_13221 [Trachymyrmex cornetzi]
MNLTFLRVKIKVKVTRRLFAAGCVKGNIYYLRLSQNVYNTSEKFNYFISCLRQECVINKRDAVNMLHNVCDKSSLIECELVAYALDQIVCDTLHE